MTRPAPRRANAAHGFTLLELLVVIVIIMILAGILMPTLSKALRAADSLNASSRIQKCSTGLGLYYKDFNFYPGQRYQKSQHSDQDGSVDPRPGDNDPSPREEHITGSQLMAQALYTPKARQGAGFNYDQWQDDGKPEWEPIEGEFPVSTEYAEYKEDMLHVFNHDTQDEPYRSRPAVSDGVEAHDARAICYYIARHAENAVNPYHTTDQYWYTDNWHHTRIDGPESVKLTHTWYQRAPSNNKAVFKWKDYIRDPDMPKPGKNQDYAYNEGEFLLIAPGPDRTYFTQDDVTNFGQ